MLPAVSYTMLPHAVMKRSGVCSGRIGNSDSCKLPSIFWGGNCRNDHRQILVLLVLHNYLFVSIKLYLLVSEPCPVCA